VQDLLLILSDPSSLREIITKAIRCNNRLFECRQEKKVTSNTQPWNNHLALPPTAPQTTVVTCPASFGLTPMQIQYRPGAQQGKVDALFRCLEYELREGDEAYGQHTQTLLKPEQFRISTTVNTLLHSEFIEDIKIATEGDTWATKIIKELQQ
jgi:hypothetical protein